MYCRLEEYSTYCTHKVPLEIVDVETTGYVLRLCPFESLSFSGATLNQEDMAAFIEVRKIYFILSGWPLI